MWTNSSTSPVDNIVPTDTFILLPIYKIYEAVQGSLEERQSVLATYDV
jgi:hypothetical protein